MTDWHEIHAAIIHGGRTGMEYVRRYYHRGTWMRVIWNQILAKLYESFNSEVFIELHYRVRQYPFV